VNLLEALLNGPEESPLPEGTEEAIRESAVAFYAAGGTLTLMDWLLLPETFRRAFLTARLGAATEAAKEAACEAALTEAVGP